MIDYIIILILVFFNGLFSLIEVALISARRSKLQTDAKNGSRRAQAALSLMDEPDTYISICQIGITAVSILTGLYSGEHMSDDVAYLLTLWGVAPAAAMTAAKTIVVIVATYLSVEFGEVFPKRIGIDYADRLAPAVAPAMRVLAHVSAPIVWFLSYNTELLSKLFHLRGQAHSVTEEEVKSIIQEGTLSGEVQEVEQDIMERALFLGDQRVGSLMTHRVDLVTLDAEMTAAEVEEVLRNDSFANYPVVDGSLDEVLGIVSLKQLVLHIGKDDFDLTRIMTKPAYFPENMTVYKALAELKAQHKNCALVCDEFGSVVGLIALKDILEGLVGSIDEETEEPDIVERPDHNSWEVNGQCLFYDFLAYFDREDVYTNDFATVGGLLLDELEHIPEVGEHLVWNGFDLEVAEMDEARISKVIVRRTDEAPSDE